MQDFREILGHTGLIVDVEMMARFLDDPLGRTGDVPVAILRPSSTAQVQDCVRICAEKGLKIVPQGGLTGLTQAGVPTTSDTVILSLENLSRTRSIDPAGGTIIVESGVTLQKIRDAAEAAGKYFPLHHGAVGTSQIGGNLSTNAGGNNALRYGTARDQVLGLEVVLPDGSLWDGLSELRKNTAGYDLRQNFIGAEGTLGIITAAVLKLRPYPHNRVTTCVGVETAAQALALLTLLSGHLGETISAFELMSDKALDFALHIQGTRYPFEIHTPWVILIEAETAAKGFDLAGALETGLESAFEQDLILDAVIAQSVQQRDLFWHLRESIAYALIEDKSCLKSDTAVPVGCVPMFIENTTRAVEACLPGAQCVPFGHLGDGNVHFNVTRSADMTPENFHARWHDLASVIADESLKLGGTFSAEHGVGRLKKEEFLRRVDPVALRVMSNIKSALDPDARMNPGVLFDEP